MKVSLPNILKQTGGMWKCSFYYIGKRNVGLKNKALLANPSSYFLSEKAIDFLIIQSISK